jgi:hypothetical protein
MALLFFLFPQLELASVAPLDAVRISPLILNHVATYKPPHLLYMALLFFLLPQL